MSDEERAHQKKYRGYRKEDKPFIPEALSDRFTDNRDPDEAPVFASSRSGAQRESIGTKIDTTLVPYELILAAAQGLNYGAEKYSERNFELGLPMRTLLGSIERHNQALKDGENIDADSGLPHFVLLASSVAMLCHNIMQDMVEDDRPVAKRGIPISTLAKTAKASGKLDDVPSAARLTRSQMPWINSEKGFPL